MSVTDANAGPCDSARNATRPWRLAIVALSILLVAGIALFFYMKPNHVEVDERRMEEAIQQRDAVAAIKESGGLVAYDYMADYARGDKRGRYGVDHAPHPNVPKTQLEALGRDYFAYVDSVLVRNPETIQHLKGLPRMPRLELVGPETTDDAIIAVRELPRLEYLELRWTAVTDAGLTHLVALKNLTSLTIVEARISDAGLSRLVAMPSLESLSLEKTEITGASVEHIAAMKQLRHLSLRGAPIADSALVHIKGMSGLRSLGLDNTQISDRGMMHIRDLSGLEYLSLDGTQITDASIEHLLTLQRLWWLSLNETRITAQGFAKLRQSSFLNCSVSGHAEK